MTNTAIGLEVTSLCVRVAEVQLGKSGMTLAGLAEEPLPTGAVMGGEVRDPDAVANALRTLWNKHKIRNRKVILGVAGQRVAVRNTTIPWMPAEDMHSALPLHVSDVLPFDSAEAVLDFVIEGEDTDDEGNRRFRGILVAAALDFVQPLVEAVQAAKLTVVSVDLTAFAVLRAYLPPPPAQLRIPTEAIVNVESQMTSIIVHCQGRPRLVRGLVVGSDAVAEQYARLDTSSPNAGFEALEPLVDEIVTTLEYYRAAADGNTLARVVIGGEGSVLPGIEYAIGSALQIPVVREAAWLSMPRLQLAISMQEMQSMASTMAPAVGLAMGAAA